MLFNSFSFWVFLSLVLTGYLLVPIRFRKYVLLLGSNIFLADANWQSLVLLYFVTIVSFLSAKTFFNGSGNSRKRLLFLLSVLVLAGVLATFKYLSLINSLLSGLFNVFLGSSLHHNLIGTNILLLLGISFYIFQAIGYLISVYRGMLEPERNLLDLASYLFFFPKLLAGPIERAENFLPQLKNNRKLYYYDFVNGSKLIIIGLFKKLVIADRIAVYVNAVFNNFEYHSSRTIIFAGIIYVFQIYTDFSGYTDIARGVARLFGYKLMENFERPLLAQNVSSFWRKWHISLSTWAMDYIYYPIVLKFRNWGSLSVLLATMLTFLLIGIWHGPTWNFVLFGLLQMIFVFYDFKTKKLRKRIRDLSNNHCFTLIYKLTSWIITFALITFSMVFFRFENVTDIFNIITRVFTSRGVFYFGTLAYFSYTLFGIFSILVFDIWREFFPRNFLFSNNKNFVMRQLPYLAMVLLILTIGVFDGGEFIYVQF